MNKYAERIYQNNLFSAFDRLCGYEDVTEADVINLKQLVLSVADKVGPDLDQIRLTFSQYTEHDLSHSWNVADLIYRFLPKKTKNKASLVYLNALEVAILWLGILLHDVGMSVTASEKEETLKSRDYEQFLNHHHDRVTAAKNARGSGAEIRARRIEDALLAEYYRRMHPERVRKYIKEKLSALLIFSGVDLGDTVADLCESHGWGVRESNDPFHSDKSVSRLDSDKRARSVRINLRYLACCLRLGDVLDFDRSRTPLTVFEEIDFTEEESEKEWNKHISVTGWDINETHVRFDTACTKPVYYVAVHDFLDWIDAELSECRYLLEETPASDEKKYQLNLPHAVDRRRVKMEDSRYLAGKFRFMLQFEEIMQLLMDKSLYPSPALFLRELLQNALDACRYQVALASEAGMTDKYNPRIAVYDYSSSDEPRIVFQDNGIGMSQTHVENFFLRVGRSFYRSPEFAAERKRLASKGIHFDTCSQFGIGFLSCFLVGDRVEVETFRHGSVPLKISIVGPSKYFLVERLSSASNPIQFRSPDDEAEDGPPRFPGTRVTVFLGGDAQRKFLEENLVYATLDAYAVNQEYEIKVFRDSLEPSLSILPRRWVNGTPPFCDEGEKIKPTALSRLAPFVFDLHDYSDELFGKGAIWMLKGADGTPCPACGDLELSGTSVDVASEDLIFFPTIWNLVKDYDSSLRTIVIENIVDHLIKIPFSSDNFIAAAREFDDEVIFQELREFAEDYDFEFKILDDDSRTTLIELCEVAKTAKKPKDLSWHESDVMFRILSTGDRKALIAWMKRHGIPSLNDRVSLSNFCMVSLFGIKLPGGVTEWMPEKGVATPLSVVPDTVAVYVDAYGSIAPQPSASRLFTGEKESRRLRLVLGRAILHSATALYRQHRHQPQWERWYKEFLDECGVIAGSVMEDIGAFEEYIEIPCRVRKKDKRLTPREVCKMFSSPIQIISSDDTSDGIYARHWIVEVLPHVLSDGKEFVDLTPLQDKLGTDS